MRLQIMCEKKQWRQLGKAQADVIVQTYQLQILQTMRSNFWEPHTFTPVLDTSCPQMLNHHRLTLQKLDVKQKGVVYKLHPGPFINRTAGEFMNQGLSIQYSKRVESLKFNFWPPGCL